MGITTQAPKPAQPPQSTETTSHIWEINRKRTASVAYSGAGRNLPAEGATLRGYQRPSTARPPRSAIGRGTIRTTIESKCISVRLTATELAKARYQPRNTCDG